MREDAHEEVRGQVEEADGRRRVWRRRGAVAAPAARRGAIGVGSIARKKKICGVGPGCQAVLSDVGPVLAGVLCQVVLSGCCQALTHTTHPSHT